MKKSRMTILRLRFPLLFLPPLNINTVRRNLHVFIFIGPNDMFDLNRATYL